MPPSSPAVLATLAWVRSCGFKPLPILPNSKAAAVERYAAPDWVPPSDSFWHDRELGIGVVLGPSASGPVDVDLDCHEAVFFAPYFFPPTSAQFGRPSALHSHRVYVVPDTEFVKFAYVDPKFEGAKKTIIEVRGDAHQTVFPGSVHPSGETIAWSGGLPRGAPTGARAGDLVRAAEKVSIATVFVRHIYAEGFHNDSMMCLAGKMAYAGWSQDEAEQMCSAIMAYAGDRDSSRAQTVRLTYRRYREGKPVGGLTKLGKIINDDKLISALNSLFGDEVSSVLEEYNERFAVALWGGAFGVIDLATTDFITTEAFKGFYAHETVTLLDAKGNPRRKPKPDLWLANPRRRHYTSLEFRPGVEDADMPNGVYNQWRGWATKPDPEGTCGAWLELLRTVIAPDPTDSKWLEHWFAQILRTPLIVPGTVPVVIGQQGAGKTMLVNYFGQILGEKAYLSIASSKQLIGQFNQHLATALLVQSEEALFAGDHQQRSILKSLITDPVRIVERKYSDARFAPNYLRFIFTSNESRAAAAEMGDRRYSIFDVEDRKIPDDLVKRVLNEQANGGPAALHHYLTTMKYDPDIPRTNVKNAALTAMKAHNLPPHQSWWWSVLETGVLLDERLIWAQDPINSSWPEAVSKRALECSYHAYAKAHSARYLLNDMRTLIDELRKLMGRKTGTSCFKDTTKRTNFHRPDEMPDESPFYLPGSREHQCILIPTLEECRVAFEKHLGQSIDWPEIEPDMAFPDDRPVSLKPGEKHEY